MKRQEIFKKCPMCATVWHDRKSFIDDNSLVLNGYQAHFDRLELGLFYFTHKVEGCFSTMTVKAGHFYDLNPAIPHTGRKTLTEECPTHCLHKEDLELCSAQCECAFVRDLIGILQEMKSNS
ncbi:MAG: hypothetical protein V2I36_19475 [Desulfopila sp.]|jgi:hypothetical protein|nr:hypothetical protein [Desulfopila sp.]